MCLIMEVAKRAKVSPFRVFLQAAVSQDPQEAQSLAESWHYEWLVDDLVNPTVEHFCQEVLNIVKKRRR